MNSKEFLTRIQMKRDTSSNWVVNNPVLLDGEVVIVDTDAGDVRYKVGDGTKKFTQLPFTDENMLNLVNSKQDKLVIDAAPATGSSNPVASGGVKDYAVPMTRTVNGKSLSSDITLSASDIGADASGSAAQALTDAKTYVNGEIAAVEGTIAGLASAYESKSDASAKLAEAKAYTDTVAEGKSDASHDHDDRYYTEADINTIVAALETKEDASAKLTEANTYTDTKVSGLASTATVDSKISAHNTATNTHTDIRALITDLTAKVSNFLDVDDETVDQLSEVLDLIEANEGTIESLTSSKVSVSDIANDLTTNVATKVLSAAQGVLLQSQIASVNSTLDTHTTNTSNPHKVTASQVGLGNVNNTSDANKPVSTAQAAAIADAKNAGTQAQTNLNTHTTNKSNPHGVTLAQLGVSATAAELNYVDGVTSNVQTQLNAKVATAGDTMTGTLTNNAEVVAAKGLRVSQSDGSSGYGLSLYGTSTPQEYGIYFGKTATYGTHGSVTSDWATYFGMNSGASTRGWVFRRQDGCVASISGAGNLQLNGTATVGGHAKMTYDSTNECLNFAFA